MISSRIVISDRIDREILRLHAEGCPRGWVMKKVGINDSSSMAYRVKRLGISFAHHGCREAVLCPNGHNARVLGHQNGACVTCGRLIRVPDRLRAMPDGTIRLAPGVKRPKGVRQPGSTAPDMGPDYEAILALEVKRESTPRYLREEIDEQLAQLRRRA